MKIKNLLLIILFIGLFIIFGQTANKIFPSREFRLTDDQGVIYSKMKLEKTGEEKTTELPKIYIDKENYLQTANKSLPFTFLYPKDLVRSKSDLDLDLKITGFEEYFTLPPLSSGDIYSYPGALGNPEKTEKDWTFFIRIFAFRGDRKNTQDWLKEFQANLHKSKIRNENLVEFYQYEDLFGQKYNKTLVTSDKDFIGLIMLIAKNNQDFKKGEEMLNIIISTFKWKNEKNNF